MPSSSLPTGTRRSRLRRRVVVVSVAALILAAINVVQFFPIETTRDPDMDALNVVAEPGEELIDVALAESGNIRRWFSSHAAIGERAPGAVIELPLGAGFSTPQIVSSLYAYGKASEVRVVEAPSSVVDIGAILTPEGKQILANEMAPAFLSGTGKIRFGEWILLTSDSGGAAKSLVAYEHVDGDVVTMVMIDERLLNSGELERRG